MILTVTAWSVLDGSMAVQVAVSEANALGLDEHPVQWRSMTGPTAGYDLQDPRDALALVGECLIALAYDERPAQLLDDL